MRLRLRLLTLLLCLAGVAWPFAAQTVRADCRLNNSGFEGGFVDRFGDGHVVIANGWEFWFQDGPDQAQARNWRPSYGSHGAYYLGGRRVRSGNAAHRFGNQWATHNAGLLQRVAVPRDSQVTFTIWGLAWSSSEDDPNSVVGPGNYRLSIGIDPTGGTNWAAPTVRWTEPRVEYNTWIHFSISATAEADSVTVFVRGNPEHPVRHNESTWDDACLTVVPPTPVPTATPRPTNTPTRVPTPTRMPPPANTPTPTRTATPANTPTPTRTVTPAATATPAGATICVWGFEDRNGNGGRDEGEANVPGARVTVLDSRQAEVASATIAAGNEPTCFRGLASGTYNVKAQLLPGYEATTPKDWAIVVPAGGSLRIDLGLRLLPTATPTPAPTSTPAPTPTPTPAPPSIGSFLSQNVLGISGVLLAGLAVALFVGARYLRTSG